MIRTEKLTKDFGKLNAVNELNLNIEKGEIYALLGPNGAGKTTTIKMLVGILPPTSGRITIGDIDIEKDPVSAKKLIGYIPDVPFVYPYMTGQEFLNFVAEIYKVPQKDEKIKKLLMIFPIEEMIGGYFKDFSRGTKQKLVILATFLHDPKVLVIDEPILGLDPKSTRATKKLLLDFKKKGGTVLVCTHTLSFVEEIADRIGVIDKGKIIFEGNIGDLRKKVKVEKGELEDLFLKLTQ